MSQPQPERRRTRPTPIPESTCADAQMLVCPGARSGTDAVSSAPATACQAADAAVAVPTSPSVQVRICAAGQLRICVCPVSGGACESIGSAW